MAAFSSMALGRPARRRRGMLSGSVWGCRRDAGNSEIGFGETWNSTDNKIEVTALAHNDSLLILDETTLAGGSDQKACPGRQ